MKIDTITAYEFEDLAERCFNDSDLISDFVKKNYLDFQEYMTWDRHLEEDVWVDHEIDFCEANDLDFVEFGFNKHYTGPL